MNFFFKNISGTKINPATEETLAAIQAQTDLLSSDLSNIPSKISVNAAAGNTKFKNAADITTGPSTQATLATIKGTTDGLVFDGRNGLQATGTAPALASTLNVKDRTSTTINPVTKERITLLRRMVKLMESGATVDATNAQRVSVDSFGASVSATGISGDGVPLVTMASDWVPGTSPIITPTTYVGYNGQMFQDRARHSYARGIRSRLIFS